MILLADDLTGACDVGAEFLRRGWSVECRLAAAGATLREGRAASVTVIDLETRRKGMRAAVEIAAGVGRKLHDGTRRPAYFKIDSTLRGHFIEEAEVLRRCSFRKLSWLVPANPGMERWTVGGRQFVAGRPIELTAFARDPLHPVKCGDLIAEVKRRIGAGRCAHLGLADLARGPGHVGRLRKRWLKNGARAVVADAVREQDLERMARCVPREDLACGAASLAGYLLGSRARRRAGSMGRALLSKGRTRVLGIVGSLNPVTREQVLQAEGKAGVAVKRLGPAELGGPPGPAPGAHVRWLIVVLDSRKFRAMLSEKSPGAASRRGETIARALGRQAASYVKSWKPTALLMSGGLTAAAVCEALKLERFELVAELAPGLVLSRAGSLAVVTKPGGFGASGALAALIGARGLCCKGGRG